MLKVFDRQIDETQKLFILSVEFYKPQTDRRTTFVELRRFLGKVWEDYQEGLGKGKQLYLLSIYKKAN